MKKFAPGNATGATKTAFKINTPQEQQAGQNLSVSTPVAWVRRLSIEDRLKVNNVRLMPSTSLCSLELTLKTFRGMELVKKIILQHLQRCSTAACWLAILVLAFAIVDVEVTHRLQKDSLNQSERLSSHELVMLNANEIAAVATKSVISFLTLLMCFNVYLTYASICKFDIARNLLPDSATIFNSYLLFYYVLESVVCFFHIPPLVDRYLGISYKLQLLVLLRVYVVARYMKEHNQFTKNKTCLFLASVTGTELSNAFLFKAVLKKMPFKVIVTTYLLNMFLGAYAIYIIEDEHSYLDSTWMVIVTMTTLGFGDVVPKTFFGRLLTGLMSILGIFLMALLISVIHEMLQLSQNEKRILAHLENADHNTQKKIAAAKLIQSYWRFFHYIKANRESLAWKRMRQVARLKKLKNHLYTNLHLWRQHKKISADHWYKEFIADDIAMTVTDVARAVDKIQFTLNRISFNQGRGRRSSLQKDVIKECTTDEEVEERPTWKHDHVTNVRMHLDTKRVRAAGAPSYISGKETQPDRGDLDHKHPFCQSSPGNVNGQNDSPPAEISRGEIEQKLESMERYLDGFYTKAKADLRDMKKIFRDKFVFPSNRSSQD